MEGGVNLKIFPEIFRGGGGYNHLFFPFIVQKHNINISRRKRREKLWKVVSICLWNKIENCFSCIHPCFIFRNLRCEHCDLTFYTSNQKYKHKGKLFQVWLSNRIIYWFQSLLKNHVSYRIILYTVFYEYKM